LEVKARGEAEGDEAMGMSGPKGDRDGGAWGKDQIVFEPRAYFVQQLSAGRHCSWFVIFDFRPDETGWRRLMG